MELSILTVAILLFAVTFLFAGINNIYFQNVVADKKDQLVQIVFTNLSSNQSNLEQLQIDNANTITSAKTVYDSLSMQVPRGIKSFVLLIPNEAHEEFRSESHKLLSTHNSYFMPTNLTMYNDTSLVIINADAPWDTPHSHALSITNTQTGEIIKIDSLDYGNTSSQISLRPGEYKISDNKYEWMNATINVLENKNAISKDKDMDNNLVVGSFVTPTIDVKNKKDNDGGVHPGWLGYYKDFLPKNGFNILSTYNYTYAACKYCPGGYWPDNKTGNHTIIIYETHQPIENALEKLRTIIKDNPYI